MSSYSIEKGDKHLVVSCLEKNPSQELIKTIFAEYLSHFEDWNVVFNLSSIGTLEKDVIDTIEEWFLHVKNGDHSFIIACLDENIGHFLPNIEQVPSITEAQDLLFMEEVERDLGVHLDFNEEE